MENLTDYEKEGVKLMMPDLLKSINAGIEFVKEANEKK